MPGLVYSWLALPVHNTVKWENVVCILLKKVELYNAKLGREVEKLLCSRLEEAVTEDFKAQINLYLTLSDGRK